MLYLAEAYCNELRSSPLTSQQTFLLQNYTQAAVVAYPSPIDGRSHFLIELRWGFSFVNKSYAPQVKNSIWSYIN